MKITAEQLANGLAEAAKYIAVRQHFARPEDTVHFAHIGLLLGYLKLAQKLATPAELHLAESLAEIALKQGGPEMALEALFKAAEQTKQLDPSTLP